VSGAKISAISPSSPAASRGIEIGDVLVSVNGQEPTDIIEYQQLIDGAKVTLMLQREGEALQRKVVIEKEIGQPLGLSIDSAVFDRIRTCDNHCTFCFIYQLPKGMRRSLYVKDDDFRLSFLYGNYTTHTVDVEIPAAEYKPEYREVQAEKTNVMNWFPVVNGDGHHRGVGSLRAGNGLDDDHNGYVDDIHGWNFVDNNNDVSDDDDDKSKTQLLYSKWH
jgi:hypothetical protein